MLRTKMCNEVRKTDVGNQERLSGWVDTIRDHGGVVFIDLRDESGVTQVVLHDDKMLEGVNRETVISVTGKIRERGEDMLNPKLETGEVELFAEKLEILGPSRNQLPFEIRESRETREDLRLKYRYLDLRNPEMHDNIIFRAKLIKFLRAKMEEQGFMEIQTPILTASSPEGARDYLVPSRKHKGRFYARRRRSSSSSS